MSSAKYVKNATPPNRPTISARSTENAAANLSKPSTSLRTPQDLQKALSLVRSREGVDEGRMSVSIHAPDAYELASLSAEEIQKLLKQTKDEKMAAEESRENSDSGTVISKLYDTDLWRLDEWEKALNSAEPKNLRDWITETPSRILPYVTHAMKNLTGPRPKTWLANMLPEATGQLETMLRTGHWKEYTSKREKMKYGALPVETLTNMAKMSTWWDNATSMPEVVARGILHQRNAEGFCKHIQINDLAANKIVVELGKRTTADLVGEAVWLELRRAHEIPGSFYEASYLTDSRFTGGQDINDAKRIDARRSTIINSFESHPPAAPRISGNLNIAKVAEALKHEKEVIAKSGLPWAEIDKKDGKENAKTTAYISAWHRNLGQTVVREHKIRTSAGAEHVGKIQFQPSAVRSIRGRYFYYVNNMDIRGVLEGKVEVLPPKGDAPRALPGILIRYDWWEGYQKDTKEWRRQGTGEWRISQEMMRKLSRVGFAEGTRRDSRDWAGSLMQFFDAFGRSTSSGEDAWSVRIEGMPPIEDLENALAVDLRATGAEARPGSSIPPRARARGRGKH